ncbi:MAG: glycoside hydrolase family 127 protein [Promethearchaeota archaeon]
MFLTPILLQDVSVTGGFWKKRQDMIRRVTLPATLDKLVKTGRIDAFKLNYQGDHGKVPPHVFWDSDVAKWVESASKAIMLHPDSELEKQLTKLVNLIISAQQPDGYLNTHFTVVEKEKRWTNLRDKHELYCAGHLIEAAIAYFQATGNKNFLDAMCKYADYIEKTFGVETGKMRGYPGHQEIEIALVKLFKITGNKKYLNLASYFIDERGNLPYYFEVEAERRGEKPKVLLDAIKEREYRQSHLPVRDQEDAVGHAVRALYMYTAMAKLARENRDDDLFKACKKLWFDVFRRKVYITGGIGSRRNGEAFGDAYELPNEEAYAETCAAIASVFWNQAMLQLEPSSKYADAIERALYNGILSGISLDGKSFFYENPLAVFSPRKHSRAPWFPCSCCPNNLTRLILSIGEYIYATDDSGVFYIHQFIDSSTRIKNKGNDVKIYQKTKFPWEGQVNITLTSRKPIDLALKLRIPEWADEYSIIINDARVEGEFQINDGYVTLILEGKEKNDIVVEFKMQPIRIYSHPKVKSNIGRVAIQRGPLIYCIEEVDNGEGLDMVFVPKDAKLEARFEKSLINGITVVEVEGFKVEDKYWKEKLYSPSRGKANPMHLLLVPYFSWANRTPGEMLVWIKEQDLEE